MQSSVRRVVVTGLGVVSPVGSVLGEGWSNLLECGSGISPLEGYGEEYRCRIGGVVRGLDLEKHLSVKEQQRLDPFCWYAASASDQAMEMSGLRPGENISCERIGVMVTSGIGGLSTIAAQQERLLNGGARQVSPLTIPMMIADMAAGFIAIRTTSRDPTSALSRPAPAASIRLGRPIG